MLELSKFKNDGVVTVVGPSGLLNREQLAKRYQVGIRTITNWMKRRIIPFIRIDHVIRFDVVACDAALKAREVKSPFVTERGVPP